MKTLEHMAAKCQFSDDARNDRLRDRLIAGIRNDRMLRSLLSEKLADLTFDKAVQRCVAIEQAAKDVETLKGTGPLFSSKQAETETDGIHQVTTSGVTCYPCNGNQEAKAVVSNPLPVSIVGNKDTS